ncbi:MAG: DNA polymerase III subunit gamma/tau [Nitrospira sp.]|nr:DNA polymerase III subunit gamma/tau [Nitrospira sp.]
MDYQVSARKFRPATFKDVIGQPHVVQTLSNAIASKRIAHAFLFSGTRGIGKTTMARILAKALNCEQGPTATPCGVCVNCKEITNGTSVDVVEIDGASNTGVDDVREIRENVKFTPFHGQYRVYIIDEVHMLSTSAFNALLKTLEEPPAHVIFIFATTEIHKIPATILSRCQHYNFRRIPHAEIVQRLRFVAQQDGLTVEDRSFSAIARASEGSMRDALSILDQAVAFAGKSVKPDDLETLLGTVPQEHVRTMVAAVIAQDGPAAVNVIAQLLDQGHDLRAYAAALVEYARHMLVAAVVPSAQELPSLIEAPEEDIRQIVSDAKSFSVEQVQELFRILAQAEDALRLSAHPRFVLESAAIKAARLSAASAQVSPPTPAPSAPPRPTAPPPLNRPATTQSASLQGRPAPPSRPAAPSPPYPTTLSASSAPAKPSPAPAKPAAPAPAAKLVSQPQSGPPVQLNWEQVVEHVSGKHPNVGAFLEMGSLVGIEGNQVMIGYPASASVARSMMDKPATQQVVVACCSALAGQPVKIRVVELAASQTAAPSPAQARAARARSQKDALLEQTRTHPLVKQARDVFGSDVVDIRQAERKETT